METWSSNFLAITFLIVAAIIFFGKRWYRKVFLPQKLLKQIGECKTSREARRLVAVAVKEELEDIRAKALDKKRELFFQEEEQAFQENLSAALGSEEKLLDLLRRIDPLGWWYGESSRSDHSQHIALIQKELRLFTEKLILEVTTSAELTVLKKERRISDDLEPLYKKCLARLVVQEVIVATSADAECFANEIGNVVIDGLIAAKMNMLRVRSLPHRRRTRILEAIDCAINEELTALP